MHSLPQRKDRKSPWIPKGNAFRTLTCESVSEGHPDKVADYVADAVLDACLASDPFSRVAVEVMCKGNSLVMGGEITTGASLDYETIAREAVRDAGYNDPAEVFCDDTVKFARMFSEQGYDLAAGISAPPDSDPMESLKAGDQGIVYGYATKETAELLPLPLVLAHRLTRKMAEDRKSGRFPWMKPDSKAQVSVLYEKDMPRQVTKVVVSTHHNATATRHKIREYVTSDLVPATFGEWLRPGAEYLVNNGGNFLEGGPAVDCGVTGRKLMVDSYGGVTRHGGGAFSGKDPTKLDRSGAYFCRWVARQAVLGGLAERCEVSAVYAIGRAVPLVVDIDTFGTGDTEKARDFVDAFDFRPRSIIEKLALRRPIYCKATNYGHFGKPELPWEQEGMKS